MSTEIDISLRLWVVLNRAVNAISEILQRQVEGHGITFTEFAVLEVLFHKGALPLGAIGEKVLLTSGSMTYVVDKLEQRGLLRRKACPDDRRVIHAELTDEGRTLMDQVFPEHAELIARAMGGLSVDERESAADLVRRLGIQARDSVLAPQTS